MIEERPPLDMIIKSVQRSEEKYCGLNGSCLTHGGEENILIVQGGVVFHFIMLP